MAAVDPQARKVALITGASSGIGAAVAIEAAARGYDLVLNARRADRLESLARRIRQTNPTAETLVVPGDLAELATSEGLIATTLDRFRRLDVLLNNAGFGLPTLYAEADPHQIRRQVEVNLVAPLVLTRLAIPALTESRGVVINVGSSITCVPNAALGAYGATKAGLAYWSVATGRELKQRGIRVCLVEPGPVKTEFFDALMGLAEGQGGYHPMLDSPFPWMSAGVEEVARRVVHLFERPRRRISVLRRVVWPLRMVGGMFEILPGLGDVVVGSVFRHYEKRAPRRGAVRSAVDAAQGE